MLPQVNLPRKLSYVIQHNPNCKKHCGKGENSGNQPLSTRFSTFTETNLKNPDMSTLSSAVAFNMDQCNILSFGRVKSLPHDKVWDLLQVEGVNPFKNKP